MVIKDCCSHVLSQEYTREGDSKIKMTGKTSR